MAARAICDSFELGAGSVVALYEPTYDLVRLILAPRMEEKLELYGVRYKYNKTENVIYTSTGQMGDFILRTLDNPARIIGYESSRSHIDELDTLSRDKAEQVWIKVIARNRQQPIPGEKIQNRVSVYTTPEGFRFVYERWKKNPTPDYQMIQASTRSNPFLDPAYVESLIDTYPEQLIEAYLNGQFVNLQSGTVYRNFDRQENDTDRTWDGAEPLFVGMDFNVGAMAAVVHVKDQEGPCAIDEIVGAYDTPEMIEILKSRYGGHGAAIRIYPDASGGSRKSVDASKTDISLLQQAGFGIVAERKNPFVKDRILAMNQAFHNHRTGERAYLVNVDRCPTYAECLEQQIYNPNGEPDKTAGLDHHNDAGGYFVAHDYPINKPQAVDLRFTT